jgi:hypothetical protein
VKDLQLRLFAARRVASAAKSVHLSEFLVAQRKMQRTDSDPYRLPTLHALRIKSATFNRRAVRTIINISGCEYVLALCLAASSVLLRSLPDFLFLSLFHRLDHICKITITIMVTGEITDYTPGSWKFGRGV